MTAMPATNATSLATANGHGLSSVSGSTPEWPDVATGCAHGCCLLSASLMILIGLAGIILSFLV